ncbi:hypothetical protein PP175_15025 [Aneurinibacillus sp. Ricciae_BoGa-3]|uniref:hypothetical protein n=1 Tax=Aneurinibacillus sp. Ricciae_BoGa-3 TaxID=3022697 RepID=UPI002340657E|nr:hypothetical protein [Aneurinibacillus sp. Ricciae_BoGa-3]WCK52740.1 hypothetical protein PP175_15025 [Aneurinibacillus sp. Ricciae_BoGa-3]
MKVYSPKKLFPTFIAAMLLGLTLPIHSVMAQTTALSNLYVCKKYSFTYQLPASWKKDYTVKDLPKNVDGFTGVAFYEKKYNYPLAEIVRIPVSVWADYEDSLYLKLGEKNGYVYAALMPSETLFVKNSKGQYIEVKSVSAMLNDTLHSFQNKEFMFIN